LLKKGVTSEGPFPLPLFIIVDNDNGSLRHPRNFLTRQLIVWMAVYTHTHRFKSPPNMSALSSETFIKNDISYDRECVVEAMYCKLFNHKVDE